MSEVTAISWTHATWNPHSGCAKISAGCANCYAANLPPGMRRGAEWGANTERVMASEAYLREPIRWNAAAEKAGERRRVFCGSTMDVFEDRDDLDASRARVFDMVAQTPWLDWLLTTKRADQIMRRVPRSWLSGFPPNVWVLVSVEDQRAADERIPHLLRVPAVVRGLSMEPLLGPVDLECAPMDHDGFPGTNNYLTGEWWPALGDYTLEREGRRRLGEGINWIITGGESGRGARPMQEAWARDIHRQARDAGVAIHHKQMGAWWAERHGVAHKKGGDPAEWPHEFRVREFPEVT